MTASPMLIRQKPLLLTEGEFPCGAAAGGGTEGAVTSTKAGFALSASALRTQRATSDLSAPIASAVSRILAPERTLLTTLARSASGHIRRPEGETGTVNPQTFTSSGIIPSSITISSHKVVTVSQIPYFIETWGLCTAYDQTDDAADFQVDLFVRHCRGNAGCPTFHKVYPEVLWGHPRHHFIDQWPYHARLRREVPGPLQTTAICGFSRPKGEAARSGSFPKA